MSHDFVEMFKFKKKLYATFFYINNINNSCFYAEDYINVMLT